MSNVLELISKDGIHLELFINGEKQEQMVELTIHATPGKPIEVNMKKTLY